MFLVSISAVSHKVNLYTLALCECNHSGVQMYLFNDESSGLIPNNDVIITNNFGQMPHVQCISGSQTPSVGQWISPSGQDITYKTTDPFDVVVGDENDPGYLDISLHTGQFITYQDQGVYTCRIPDETGTIVSLHVGIYLPALTSKSQNTSRKVNSNYYCTQHAVPVSILSLGESTETVFTLRCTSTGSPPTNLTWTKDGEVVTADENFEVTQILRSGVISSYDNLLKINSEPSEVVGTYTCTVDNSISEPIEQILVIEGK